MRKLAKPSAKPASNENQRGLAMAAGVASNLVFTMKAETLCG